MSTQTTSPFSEFMLDRALLDAINKQNYKKPTPIQSRAIPKILDGRDVLASAETGSGKTAAYALPLLQGLLDERSLASDVKTQGHHISALVLVPTRELAVQVTEMINQLSVAIRPRLYCMSACGGVDMEEQAQALRKGTDILVVTPARLLDLMDAKAVVFNQLQTLVLDEVDRLITQNFQYEIESILKHLPNQRQNLFFTATFPDSIRKLVRRVLKNPEVINVPLHEKILIDQHAALVNQRDKISVVQYLVTENDWEQVLIFASAKRSCDHLVNVLEESEIEALGLHGNIPTEQREQALARFKAGEVRILVATDIAARGLDIGQLDCVINYELPNPVENYTHRIGRTGRAGKTGQAISLVAHHELGHFKAIEKHAKVRLPRETIEGFEPDEVAPPAPTRKKPKKTVGKKKRTKQKAAKKQKSQSKLFLD